VANLLLLVNLSLQIGEEILVFDYSYPNTGELLYPLFLSPKPCTNYSFLIDSYFSGIVKVKVFLS